MSGRVSELYYEELGDNFDRFMSSYDVARRIVLMRDLVGEQRFARGLEVGCGTGRISEAFAPHIDALTVTDISSQLARKVGEELRCAFAAENACALTFADRSFDFVFSSECIEHTPDPLRAVDEMARVLAPGGTLVITTPNKLWYPVLVLALKLRLRRFVGNEIWVSSAQVVRRLTDAGLTVHAIKGCHLFPWQLPGSQRVLPFFDRFGDRLAHAMINFGIVATRPKAAIAS
jgi:SAM-dependent methyltransferase